MIKVKSMMLKRDIYTLSYSPKEIRRMLRENDFWKYNISKSEIEKIVTKNNRVITGTSGGTIAELRLK